MGKVDARRRPTRFPYGSSPISITQSFSAIGALTVLCPSPVTCFKLLGAILRFDVIGTGPSFDFQTSDLNNGLSTTDITFSAVTPVVGTVYVCSTTPGLSGSYKPGASGVWAPTDTLQIVTAVQKDGQFCLSAASTIIPSSGLQKCPAIVLAGSVTANTGSVTWFIEPLDRIIGTVR